jgi:hypothetical protein
MVDRRTLLNPMAFGGALAALGASASAAAAQSGRLPDDLNDLTRAARDIRSEMVRQGSFWEIEPVRAQLRSYLRANAKYPDFIEVGIDIWQRVYDWHVRYQQPIGLSRTADQRYAIALMQTLVIMRTDAMPDFVGTPYDNR